MKRNIEDVAINLIDVKLQIRQLQNVEKKLKNELQPYLLKNKGIRLPNASIYYYQSKSVKRFSRKTVLSFVRKNYSKDIADRIDKECSVESPPVQYVAVNLYLYDTKKITRSNKQGNKNFDNLCESEHWDSTREGYVCCRCGEVFSKEYNNAPTRFCESCSNSEFSEFDMSASEDDIWEDDDWSKEKDDITEEWLDYSEKIINND